MTFGGFTEQQIRELALRMGFDGPIEKFNEFLAASPDKAALFSRLTNESLKGKQAPSFNQGGMVTFNQTTQQALKKPEELVTLAEAETITPKSNQFIPTNSGQAGDAQTAKLTTPGNAAQATQEVQPTTVTADATQVADQVGQTVDGLQAAQGTVSQNAQAQAATALPSANATVQGQLEKLMAQFEGGEIPPWAAGAKRLVDNVMIGRGMGSSTMAASASTQAIMESALEIAVRDAATFSAFEMQNLNNRQQAALQNAQAFLQMDMKNLDNEQQVSIFKTQARIQALFTDQAAENAMKQFNASSENQANQFFSQLSSQVKQFNASQKNTMAMFKAEQSNALSIFNAEQVNQRDQFNANNRLIIDQSNAQWRQQIATMNNAAENEANRLNAQLMTGMTTAAYNNMWQKERDIMAFAFTAAENAAQRAHEIVLQKLGGKNAKSIQQSAQKSQMWEAAGNLVGEMFRGLF